VTTRCIRLVCAWMATLWMAGCEEPQRIERAADLTVLARGDDAYAQARPGQPLTFPRDHGAHPNYRIEWWYLTANLFDTSGRPYGAQWTLFRLATEPPGVRAAENPWQSPQVFMAHFAVTTPQGHQGFQRYSRGGDHGGIARAGVRVEPFAAWLDDWALQSTGSDWLPMTVSARQGRTALSLRLEADGPLVLQGEEGFSRKHREGGGSYYYSQPFLRARGELEIEGETVPVQGKAWLDREWSSQFLQPGQQGWDWFALHLENGEKLMLFQLRESGNGEGKPNFRHAVLIGADGKKREVVGPGRMKLQVVGKQMVAGRLLPLHWRLELVEPDRELEIRALHPKQWMDVDFPYWEGVVIATGDGPGSRGVGYMELTGYEAE
jgi:predicted secreted hydrolase